MFTYLHLQCISLLNIRSETQITFIYQFMALVSLTLIIIYIKCMIYIEKKALFIIYNLYEHVIYLPVAHLPTRHIKSFITTYKISKVTEFPEHI